MSLILDGTGLSRKIGEQLKKRISVLEPAPKLAIVQIGDKKESEIYIGRKIKYAKNIGALCEHIKLSKSISQEKLEEKIKKLNGEVSINGIIVQLPVTEHIDFFKIFEIIDFKKDVDGLGPDNLKHLWQNDGEGLLPATVRGVLELLEEYKIPIAGRKVTIVNRSILVGRPLTIALLNRDAIVSVCHSKINSDLIKKEMLSADIVITAVGRPGIFGEEFFKVGQTVIDVGISYGSQKVHEETGGPKLSGDVQFEKVKDKVYAISPVPGGAGPMTVACLFKNLLAAYNLQQSKISNQQLTKWKTRNLKKF